MVFSGVSAPLLSPSRIIHIAGLSLTEPPGLRHSALPSIRTPGVSAAMAGNSSNGVLPTSSVTFFPACLLILVIMSGLIIQGDDSASREGGTLQRKVARRPKTDLPGYGWCVGGIIPEARSLNLRRNRGLSQCGENFFRGAAAAGKDRGVQLCVGACLALAELHHQILELLRALGLEGEDELVVVDAEAVGGVVFYGVVLAAYVHVLVHHPLALFEGEAVPLAGLYERVDEDVLALARDDVAAVLPAWGVLADVDGAAGEAEVRVGDRQLLAEAAVHQGALQAFEGVEVVPDFPEHKVRIRPQAHERERPEQHLPAVLLHGLQEFPLSGPPLPFREAAPERVQLEEDVVYVLGGKLLFLGLLLLGAGFGH